MVSQLFFSFLNFRSSVRLFFEIPFHQIIVSGSGSGSGSKLHVFDARNVFYIKEQKYCGIFEYFQTFLEALKKSSYNRVKREMSETFIRELELKITDVDPLSLAVDWVGDNLYWIDFNLGKPRIMITDLQGKTRRKLVSKLLTKPHTIALDPIRGYVILDNELYLLYFFYKISQKTVCIFFCKNARIQEYKNKRIVCVK